MPGKDIPPVVSETKNDNESSTGRMFTQFEEGVNPVSQGSEVEVPVPMEEKVKKRSKAWKLLHMSESSTERPKEESKTASEGEPHGMHQVPIFWYFPGAPGLDGFGHTAIQLPEIQDIRFTVHSGKYLSYGRGKGLVQDSNNSQVMEEKNYNPNGRAGYAALSIALPPCNLEALIRAAEHFGQRERADYNLLTNSCAHAALQFMQDTYNGSECDPATTLTSLNTLSTFSLRPLMLFKTVRESVFANRNPPILDEIKQKRTELLHLAEVEPNKLNIIIQLIENDIERLVTTQILKFDNDPVALAKRSLRGQKIQMLHELLAKFKGQQNDSTSLLSLLDTAILNTTEKTQAHLRECLKLLHTYRQASKNSSRVAKVEDLEGVREQQIKGVYELYFSQNDNHKGLLYEYLAKLSANRRSSLAGFTPTSLLGRHVHGSAAEGKLINELNTAVLNYAYGGEKYAKPLEKIINGALEKTERTTSFQKERALHQLIVRLKTDLEQFSKNVKPDPAVTMHLPVSESDSSAEEEAKGVPIQRPGDA